MELSAIQLPDQINMWRGILYSLFQLREVCILKRSVHHEGTAVLARQAEYTDVSGWLVDG